MAGLLVCRVQIFLDTGLECANTVLRSITHILPVLALRWWSPTNVQEASTEIITESIVDTLAVQKPVQDKSSIHTYLAWLGTALMQNPKLILKLGPFGVALMAFVHVTSKI